MNTNDMKKMASQFGADLVGIASIERFEPLSPDRNPISIFPDCKSVIVLGRRILRGSLRGVEEGTNFASTYMDFGYHWLEDNFLSQTTYDLTIWLEEQGAEAVPLFAYKESGMPKGLPVESGKPAPNVIVDFEYAAQVAGLAEMGLGGFLLTNRFGPRQRFAMILTDAELDPDPIKDKSVCDDCGACIAACPLNAFTSEKKATWGASGHQMTVAEMDIGVCSKCRNGAFARSGVGNSPDRLAAACTRACVIHLEGNGTLDNKFHNRFRKRQPWAVDCFARPVACKGGVTI